jgi:hypothetical protein
MDEDLETGVRRRRLGFAGAAALAISLACLFVGQVVEEYADQATVPKIETAKSSPHFNAIDYATTAAIKGGGTVIIGPCDTHSP